MMPARRPRIRRIIVALFAALWSAGLPGAASALDVKVNFQDPPTVPPAGYLADFGQPYGPRAGGQTYGWVVPGTATPLDLSVGGTTPGNGRNRGMPSDLRLATLMHMQADDIVGSFNGTKTEGAWEIAVPSGTYAVTVALGDGGAAVDSTHRIRVEGQVAVAGFVPTTATKFAIATANVTVSDGRLTLDATGGGVNTKVDYVDILTVTPASQPSVTGMNPANGTTDVSRDGFVSATVFLPNSGGGIDAATLDAASVQLVRTSDGTPVPANRNTSGGGDVIVLQPTGLLDANTQYTFIVTSALEDVFGNPFMPFVGTFTTGTAGGPGGGGPVSFTKVVGVASGKPFNVLEMGPDNLLYGATLEGEILRWPINGDGTLGAAQTITSIQTANGGQRAIIGLRFDPAATAGNLILWVTHSGPSLTNSPDWLGKVTRLSGPNLTTVQDYVVGLPRSLRDHQTNGLDFRPGEPTVLYVMQGSNSAMGAPDNAWGNRLEHMLNAAVLRIDLAAITSPPVDVKTDEGGTYDPFAPGAPVTVYASGTRNCYDLVWHSNGQLYVPCNGSAAGGNTPGTPAMLPAACSTRRLDLIDKGPYSGPTVPGLTNAGDQDDFLFRIVQGGYYGHPNPTRCEWAMNGANPTAGADPAQVSNYAVGVQPDRNYRGFAFDFGLHYSPDGIIEYRSTAFGGSLQGKLLVTRYSGGDDIIVLTPGGPNLDITSAQTGITGMTGFSDPLGIAEHVSTGNVYVTELAAGRVTLLRANTPPTGCVTAVDCTGSLPSCGVFACNAGVCSVVPASVGTTCRAAAGACDVTETCTGSGTSCPADGFVSAGVECRAAAGECDVAETCSGGSAACPADGLAPAGTPCSSDGNACTTDACNALGTCSHSVPAGVCDDGDQCTTDTCDPVGGCGHTSLAGQPCDTGVPGICANGLTACQAGVVDCQQTTQPAQEQCNTGLDEDCDGEIDEVTDCALCSSTVELSTQTKKTAVKLSLRIDADKVQTKGTLLLPDGAPFQPDASNVTLAITDGAGAYYLGTIPSGGFVASSNRRSFKFKDRFAPFENAGLKTAKFSVASDGRTVKYSFKAQTLNLPAFTAGTGTVTVMVGDACYVDSADQCTPAGSGAKCS